MRSRAIMGDAGKSSITFPLQDTVVIRMSSINRTCNCPIYILQYHLVCVALNAVPEGSWFCDEDCHGNAGFRERGAKKIRKRACVVE